MKFLRFLSLTTASQIVLLANQLLLLPLQLRTWGRGPTAAWFVTLALANLATIADLGLRSAGHAELLSSVRNGDRASAHTFRGVWALARTLFVAATLVIMVVQTVTGLHGQGRLPPLWVYAVTLSLALDTLVIVRGIWLDTLGHFNKVEGVFLSMVTARVLLSVVALTLFKAPPAAVAAIMLVTALAAAGLQATLLPEPTSLAFMAGGFSELRWRSLGVVRYVVAEPASNWARLSLPVLVLAAIGSPLLVTTYVGLRAVFGLGRQVINQVSRYASVAFVSRLEEARGGGAYRLAARAILLCTVVALAVTAAVIADGGRLLSVWLSGADRKLLSAIALSFGIGAAAYGYQVIAGIMMRSGDVKGVGVRQYLYLAVSVAAALAARATGSALLFLGLLAAQEVFIAALFTPKLGRGVLVVSCSGFGLAVGATLAIWIAAHLDLGNVFQSPAPLAVLLSLAMAGALVLAAAAGCLAVDRLEVEERSPEQAHRPGQAQAEVQSACGR